ncbi:uncharacterized protein L203_105818 [Cryptococcus depauperatus CBS 7841]|uniref:Uncharacterized protein n=1 Tax=Cryptococcus depauperatus CBS 7841 TaxID=1295531 RepID=A0AAJ8JY08_9TREE
MWEPSRPIVPEQDSGSLGTSGISPFPPTPNGSLCPIPVDRSSTQPLKTARRAPFRYSQVDSTVHPAHVSRATAYNVREIMSCEEDPEAGKCFMSIRLPDWHRIDLQFPSSATFKLTKEEFQDIVTAEGGYHWKDYIDKEWPDEGDETSMWLEETVRDVLGAYYDSQRGLKYGTSHSSVGQAR